MNRLFIMLRLLSIRSGFGKAEYLRKKHVFSKMGEHCYYHNFKITPEPQRISMGDNVIIASGAALITHDMSFTLLRNETCEKYRSAGEYYSADIHIGSNVMIGANAIILPGITIGDHVVIGAGSVVTKDVPSETIVAGNPARIIGEYSNYINKRSKK